MNTKTNLGSILPRFLWMIACVTLLSSVAVSATQTPATKHPSTRVQNKEPIAVPQGRCDPTQQAETDLSGTYSGKVMDRVEGLSGGGTLTVKGHDFSLTSGTTTTTGRITAVTTCGYTAVTLMFGDMTPTPGPSPPPPLRAISLQARKRGSVLELSTVQGEKTSFKFACDCSQCINPKKCGCCGG